MRPILIVALMACGLIAAARSTAYAASVTIDGQPVSGVVEKDNHLMVPFRAPLEQIGATVSWNDATSVASSAYNGSQLLTVTVGSTDATVTGSPHVLTVAPVLQNHLAYIPVEALADVSRAKVAYSADRQSAVVTGWDLAGVDAVGGGGGDFQGVLGIWVAILVVGGFAYLLSAAAVARQTTTKR